MWQLTAIVLGGVLLFFWGAFVLTVVAWLKMLAHLLMGNFTRAAVWFSIGSGMLFWWLSSDIDFDTWMGGSATLVGMAAIASLLLYAKRHSRPTVPTWPTPSGNVVPFIKVRVERERD